MSIIAVAPARARGGALREARSRAEERGDELALRVWVTSQEPQPCGRGTERAGHENLVGRVRAGAKNRTRGGNRAEDRDRDDQCRAVREVTADDATSVRVGRLAQSVVDRADLVRSRTDDRHHRRSRGPAHRGDVAEVLHEAPPADVGERYEASVEVHPFDAGVSRKEQWGADAGDHRGVIADPDLVLRRLPDHRAKHLDGFEFASIPLRFVHDS